MGDNTSLNTFTQAVKDAYQASKIGQDRTQNTAPYWWTDEVKDLRDRCNRLWRIYTREARRNDRENIVRTKNEYKEAKKDLRRLINAEKRKCWKELCEELNTDIWGTGYQIVMRGIKSQGPPFKLTKGKRAEIITTLFPNREDDTPVTEAVEIREPFTLEELRRASEKLKKGKAPGPDGIPPEAVAELIKAAPEFTLNFMNRLLCSQKFPKNWKSSKLVLIHKTGKPYDSPSAYRPLCLINTLAKLYEQLVKERTTAILEANQGIAPNQFGFIKGKSTVHSIEYVLDRVKRIKREGPGERWCALIAIDVRNAFNTASWSLILREAARKNLPEYIINILTNYLSDRSIIDAGETRRITTGIPQGPVLGPMLWNIFYDPILRLAQPEGVELVGYADDIIAIVGARNDRSLINKANDTLEIISRWLRRNHLEIAPEKTEAVIMSGPRKKRAGITFRVDGEIIIPKRHMKYLGVFLDDRLSFGPHVLETTKKARDRAGTLSRLMPNVGGPDWAKRAVLNGVVHSILLYGAPTWHPATKVKKYAKQLESVQRTTLLRVASGYRTISSHALQVITGTPPIDLLAEERRYLHEAGGGQNEEIRKRAKEVTRAEWQNRWAVSTKGRWTYTLIPDIGRWISCSHRRLNYHLSQALTGHGSFGTYTLKIKKTATDQCRYCRHIDDAEHTLLHCHRWDAYRREAATEGLDITTNLVSQMIETPKKWKIGEKMITQIMSTKELEERREQGLEERI